MWPDPTDISKRKPRYLWGTPANKYCYYFCFGIIGVTYALINLTQYVPHFKRKINHSFDLVKETEEERELKEFARDPMVQRAIASKKDSYEKKPDWTYMF